MNKLFGTYYVWHEYQDEKEGILMSNNRNTKNGGNQGHSSKTQGTQKQKSERDRNLNKQDPQ
ncbi:Small, acid-soluble spore protein N [Brevibacillus sp. IT-7CA2]